MAHAISQEKEFIIAHPEYKLSLWEWVKFKYYIYKRKQNYPLAYITGKKEFYGLDFNITEDVLVPRPETEQIVDLALEQINEMDDHILLADTGTGSGCIPISILKNLEKKKISQLETIATDISDEALEIAKKNSKKYKVEIDFRQGNLAEPIKSELKSYENVVITANLPYLTREEFNSEQSIQQEPKEALVAEEKGLELYENLLEQIKNFSLKNQNLVLFFEINPWQKENIKKLVKQRLNNCKIDFKKDLNKKDRILILRQS